MENASADSRPTQTAYPTADWLDTGGMSDMVVGNQVWPYATSEPSITTYSWTYPTRIRLTLTEVEKLRGAAKKDRALKAILKKFGPHIEIEVDFP